MKCSLFSKIEFEIPDPAFLIECYCYQSDFYSRFDVIENRTVEDVNKIGARLKSKTISACKDIVESAKKLDIFKKSLDTLLDLDEITRENQVKELNDVIFQKLFAIKGISFSIATKILHTVHTRLFR